MPSAICRPLVGLLIGLLLAGGAVPVSAQGVLDRLTGTSTAPAAPAASAPRADDIDAVSRSLEAARADQRQVAAASPPPAATQDELLERDHLLGRLVETLGRHRALFQRVADARREVTDMEARVRGWTGLPTPPPYSILFVDQLRNDINVAAAQANGVAVRRSLLSDMINDAEIRYRSADILARQSEERTARAQTDAERDRQRWLQELAHLRGRTAAEDVAEAQLEIALADAEAAKGRAANELLARQLAVARKDIQFSEADRDKALAAIDRQRDGLEVRARRLAQAGDPLRRSLEEAQRALDAAKADNTPGAAEGDRIARLTTLEQRVELARLLVDNHDRAVETVARVQEIRAWERSAWQYRWLAYQGNAGDTTRDGLRQLDQMLERLAEWGRYADGQVALAVGRVSEYERRVGDKASDKTSLAGQFLAAYRARADLEREAQQVGADLRSMLAVWRDDVGSEKQAPSARDILNQLLRAGRAVWDFELFSADDTLEIDGRSVVARRSVTVGKSVGVMLLLVLGYFLSAWLMRTLGRLAVGRLGVSEGHARTATRWAQVVLLSAIFIMALYLVSIPLTVFAFLGGALAIGIGFGTQVLLKNMISGLMLLLERPLRVGDRIEVGNVVGIVTSISIRSSTVHTAEGIEILVPNSTFIENNVTNWTYSDAQVRRSVKIGVDYTAPPERVSALLLSVAAAHPGVLIHPEPRVLLENFGDNALEFDLQYWIDYRRGADGSQIGSDLRFAIIRALGEAGVGIPYPQRVVRFAADADPVSPRPAVRVDSD